MRSNFVSVALLLLSGCYAQEFSAAPMSHSQKPPQSSRDLAEEMRMQAVSLFDQGKYVQAQRKAEIGLQIDPRNPFLSRIIGESMIRLGNFREALSIFKRQNERFKDEASFVRVGLLLAKTGQVEESRRMFAPRLVVDGFSQKANVLPAMPAIDNSRQLEGAWLFLVAFTDSGSVAAKENLFYLQAAIRIHPRNVLVNYSLGSAYMRNGEPKRALAAMLITYKYSTGHLKELAGHCINKLEERIAKSELKA